MAQSELATQSEILEFYVNNHHLNQLNSLLNKFNPLKVLGVDSYETKHSNVLAWLFDVNGQHGFRDSFLKKILCEVLKNSPNNRNKREPYINEVITSDYSDLEVKREWHNIDLLCISEKSKLLVVIENKWGASESETQLNKYYKIIENEPRFYQYKWVFIFLTINGEPPKGSDKYSIFTHEQIFKILKSTTEINREFMNKKVYDFINNYLHILEEQAMPDLDPKLVELCKTLYKENKKAIDTIIEIGKPRLSTDNINKFLTSTDTQSCSDNPKTTVYYGFIPNSWATIKGLATNNPSDKYLLYFSFNFSRLDSISDKRIVLRLDIGDFPDKAERERFIEAVKIELTAKGISTKNFTNRIISVNIPIENDISDDYDKIIEKMVSIYKSSMADYESALYTVMENFWQ